MSLYKNYTLLFKTSISYKLKFINYSYEKFLNLFIYITYIKISLFQNYVILKKSFFFFNLYYQF